MRAITFTLDLEDHRPNPTWEDHAPAMTRRVLDLLDQHRVRGTVFVVGEVAESNPVLVREVASRGHEVGLHGWNHEPLTSKEPTALAAELERGKTLLEAVTGTEVVGFRAPTFSLVPETAWCLRLLADAGFLYSSSVLPARSPLFGWPGAPRDVFRWPEGLVEFPAPTAGVGEWALPVLGGVYFRLIPWSLIRLSLRITHNSSPWTYCHPYDFDADEEYWVVPDAGVLGSRLLWWNRRRMMQKVDCLLRRGTGAPLGEQVTHFHGAQRFDHGAEAGT